MTAAPTIDHSGSRRVRASERALRIALKAVQDAGLPVDRVSVSGGQIEIHCGGIVEGKQKKNDGRLKQW